MGEGNVDMGLKFHRVYLHQGNWKLAGSILPPKNDPISNFRKWHLPVPFRSHPLSQNAWYVEEHLSNILTGLTLHIFLSSDHLNFHNYPKPSVATPFSLCFMFDQFYVIRNPQFLTRRRLFTQSLVCWLCMGSDYRLAVVINLEEQLLIMRVSIASYLHKKN